MTKQIDEQVSALMDGELPHDQLRFLLRRFDRDPALASRWSRYHRVRICLRHETDSILTENFSTAVLARLAQEPSANRMAGRGWAHWVGGGAIAAVVAIAALVSRPVADDVLSASTDAVVATPVAASKPAEELRSPMFEPSATMTSGYNYTQPASFDPGMPAYLSHRTDTLGVFSANDFTPYVLLVAPARQTSAQPVMQAHTTPPATQQN